MGLDNGIILKTRRTIEEEDIPNYVQIEKLETEENEYDICYWRKCWSLRNKIVDSITFDEKNEGCIRELTVSNITDIIQILVDYLIYPNDWDEENNFWDFADYKEHIAQNIINLGWVRQYLRENSKAYCYFYDSY